MYRHLWDRYARISGLDEFCRRLANFVTSSSKRPYPAYDRVMIVLGENFPATVESPSCFAPNQGQDFAVDFTQAADAALLQHMARGQEAALAELYDRYGRLVYSVAYGVVGSSQAAEEITLDVFTRVWEKGHTYDAGKSQVRTWLTRLARNRAIDVLRREQVRPEKDSVSWGEVTAVPLTDSQNPETQTALMMQREQVHRALAALPDDQRQALALAYFGGMSHSEIAAHLGEPLGTVKGRIRAAMIRLRAVLKET